MESCCSSVLPTSGQWKRCFCKWRNRAQSTSQLWPRDDSAGTSASAFAGSSGLGARRSQRETVGSDTTKPSFSSSPWIRGAPQVSTIIRNRRFLNLCRDAAFKLRTPQDEGLASSLAARNGAEVVRGLGDNTPRLRRQRRQTRPDIGRVDP